MVNQDTRRDGKTIRLLYPDYASGGVDNYYLGAELMERIVPRNDAQRTVRVNVTPPQEPTDWESQPVTDGIRAKDLVFAGLHDAQDKLAAERPDRVITIGGNCFVSLPSFDYLHGVYGAGNVGIIWIDAHPDVTTTADGYPYAHAMVLSALLGKGADTLTGQLKNPVFHADELMYVGLQPLHDYQTRYLEDAGVRFAIQDKAFLGTQEVAAFAGRFDHVLVHLDIDVLDPHLFNATYFNDPSLTGDGSGGGRMTLDELGGFLAAIDAAGDVAGFTVAEYLPFQEACLRRSLARLGIFRA